MPELAPVMIATLSFSLMVSPKRGASLAVAPDFLSPNSDGSFYAQMPASGQKQTSSKKPRGSESQASSAQIKAQHQDLVRVGRGIATHAPCAAAQGLANACPAE